jgi:glycosyltransferase involved in cell wall biosynthesis
MTRRRVMHVVVAGDIGGAERLLVEIARRPDDSEADHEIALMTPNRTLAAYFQDAGLVVHDRGHARENPLAYLVRSLGPFDVAWLGALLVSRRIDVVHTHTFASHVLGTRAARRANKPQLRTEHHVSHYFDPSCSVFTRWAAARTDRLVAVSDYVKRSIVQAAPNLAERMSVVRNGLDTSYWAPYSPPAPEFSLAIVCRLTRWKRVHLAIAGAALAGAELVVIGDGEDRGRLESIARSSGGSVRFVGYQADPRPFIAAASAVLSTSEQEPLGLSVLEALAMERPVIAVAEGGVPEIVQDGETGLLVRHATPDALAVAITRAREARAWFDAMGPRARRFAVDACSIEAMCQRYGGHYRELKDRT